MVNRVIFRYFDKKNAAIAALKDYENMSNIIRTTKRKVAEKQEKMYSLGGLRMDGMPHTHNQHAGENRIISLIDDIDSLLGKYDMAMDYMSWVTPAWNALSEEERQILSRFYFEGHERGDCTADDLADSLCLCVQSVHNKKNKAIEKLASLLFEI